MRCYCMKNNIVYQEGHMGYIPLLLLWYFKSLESALELYQEAQQLRWVFRQW